MSCVIEVLRHIKPSKLIFGIIAGLTVSSVSLAESNQPSGNLARSPNHEATSPAYNHSIHTEEDTKREHSNSESLSAKDAVHTSFERMMNREAAPVEFTYTPRNDVDPVQELVNTTLRGSVSEPSKDPALAGYERMMNREAAPAEFYYDATNDTDTVQVLINTAVRHPWTETESVSQQFAALESQH